jgi:hypothetical protein
MKGFFLIVTTLLSVGIAPAQTTDARVPTEESVLAAILPTDSPYLYLPMMLRYMEGDATLTDDHYYYLYYGYAWQAEYDAHRDPPGEAAMYDIFRSTEHPTREQALALIEAGRENMTVDPFSPSNINMMTWAYQIVGDSLNAARSSARFRGVVKAITSSGTGMRERSPWHILRFSHAADVVNALGQEIERRQVRTREVEYIQVRRNAAGVKGYYFDFSRVYMKPFEGERVRKQSGWMFNGTPI